jgi:hypothetical protein
MAISLLNAKLIVSTELENILESNTKLNINDNSEKNSFLNLKCEVLEWGNENNIFNIEKKYKDINLIVCCELLYKEAPFDKLFETLIHFSKFYKRIPILFAYKKRYILQEECLNQMKEYFDIKEINRNEYHKDFKDKINYKLLNIIYKK